MYARGDRIKSEKCALFQKSSITTISLSFNFVRFTMLFFLIISRAFQGFRETRTYTSWNKICSLCDFVFFHHHQNYSHNDAVISIFKQGYAYT